MGEAPCRCSLHTGRCRGPCVPTVSTEQGKSSQTLSTQRAGPASCTPTPPGGQGGPSVGARSADSREGDPELPSADGDSLGHLRKTRKLKGLTDRRPWRQRAVPRECLGETRTRESPRELAARPGGQLQTNAVSSETQGEPTGCPTPRVRDTWRVHERHRRRDAHRDAGCRQP